MSNISLFDSRELAEKVGIDHKDLISILFQHRSQIELVLGTIIISKTVAWLTEEQYAFFLSMPRKDSEIVRCHLELAEARTGAVIVRRSSAKNRRSRKYQLINRDGAVCCWCSQEFAAKKLTIEHLIPLSQGGSNCISNLRLACSPCNNARNQAPRLEVAI